MTIEETLRLIDSCENSVRDYKSPTMFKYNCNSKDYCIQCDVLKEDSFCYIEKQFNKVYENEL